MRNIPVLGPVSAAVGSVATTSTAGTIGRPPPEPPDRPNEEDDGMPLSPLEQAVADIWAEVLRVERVRRRDNFFDLGGHSLLATRVVARFRTAYRIELPLRTLFEAPTVSALARRVAQYLPSPLSEEQPVGARP